MLTFQHFGTTRSRDEEYRISVRLYGRQADGKSVALTVNGVKAYGFVKCNCDAAFKYGINSLLQWWLSMQRTEQSTKKYKKEEGDDKPIAAIFRQWDTWWFDQCAISTIKWSGHRGYNIRSVLPGMGPEVWRFEVDRYDIWRGMLSLLKGPVAFYEKILQFRRKMCNYANEKPVRPMPASLEAYLDGADVYETMFKPEVVWMVDHQLPACSWMNVSNARPGGKIDRLANGRATTCDLEFTCGVDDVGPCTEPPIPMAPFRVLSYDIEAVPYINPTSGECEFPDPKRDSIVTIGIAAFDMVSSEMVQTVFMLEMEGQVQCTSLSPLSNKTDEYDPVTTRVRSFFDEADMLAAFAEMIREYDPDVITGYNVLNFDNVSKSCEL